MVNDKGIDFEKLVFKILEEGDDVNRFCCGVKEIDDFIHKEAKDFRNERLGITYLFYYKSELIGFVTLSMADLKREKMEVGDRPLIGRENYPALLIGQLAVCKELQSSGIGTYICDFCLDKAMKFSQKVGCRFLVVNSIQKAIRFYEKYGFKMLPKQEGRKEPVMFLNIFSSKDIE